MPRQLVVLATVALLLPGAAWAVAGPELPPPGSGPAESLVQEQSFARALEVYRSLDASAMSDLQRRWVAFRIFDLSWRSSPESPDDTTFTGAIRGLTSMLEDESGEAVDDRVRPEILESLGDATWPRNRVDAWDWYRPALDWWAGARDVDEARDRYLSIVRRTAMIGASGYGISYGYVPGDVLEVALDVSRDPDDVGLFSLLVASQLHDPRDAERKRALFRKALSVPGASWRDRALVAYAQWLERAGIVEINESGDLVTKPDYEGAITFYRAFLRDYPPGTSALIDQASQHLSRLLTPSLHVGVPSTFLPGSAVHVQMVWKGIPDVTMSMQPFDLTEYLSTSLDVRALRLPSVDRNDPATRTWTHTLSATNKYESRNGDVKIAASSPAGAWLLETTAGEFRVSRELILVTDLVVVARMSGHRAVGWVVDARTGAPVPGATATGVFTARRKPAGIQTATTDENGLVEFPLPGADLEFGAIAVRKGDRQAIAHLAYRDTYQSYTRWKIYAETDRPAYRPGETVHWKISARTEKEGVLSLPESRQLKYRVTDPMRVDVSQGEVELNAFGTAWSELTLPADATLGSYFIQFTDEQGNRVGSAEIFRIEEYKLPEFSVSVTPAVDDGGRPRAYRPGDRVEATVEAAYLFGAPVAGGTVELRVWKRPWSHASTKLREYPWYFEPRRVPGWQPTDDDVVLRETLRTDASGRVRVSFRSMRESQMEGDIEYVIEASVTDASRREVDGLTTIRITRVPFFADLQPDHHLHGPGSTIEIELRTVDANDHPVAATGTAVVRRLTWTERWLDPNGRVVSGRELERLKERLDEFPPPPEPNQHAWKNLLLGYEETDVATIPVASDADGKAGFSFVAPAEGYYRVAWSGHTEGMPARRDLHARAESMIWVADSRTRALGYRTRTGLEIVLDAESARPGATVPLMLVSDHSDGWVLLTIEGSDILDTRLIRMNGHVAIVNVPVTDLFVPNVFFHAVSVFGLAQHDDLRVLVVPPASKFLDVRVSADQDAYLPRARSLVTVTTRDSDGRPVPAEVSLGVADQAIWTISKDPAGDPREFFHGDVRIASVAAGTSIRRGFAMYREIDGTMTLVKDVVAKRLALSPRRPDEGPDWNPIGRPEERHRPLMVIAEAITVTLDAPAALDADSIPFLQQLAQAATTHDALEASGTVFVRRDFRSTAFWKPDLATGDDGRASVEFTWPDTLTTWRATARAITPATAVGAGTATTRTNQPLVVRLQAPRFFVAGDRAVVSSVINNNTDRELTVSPSIDADGVDVVGSFIEGRASNRIPPPVRIAANDSARADWVVSATAPGRARIRVIGQAGDLSDGAERTYPVAEHGIEKLLAAAGKMNGGEATLRLDLPKERRAGSTTLTVQVAPSLAVTMLDALPYLIDFPYELVEPTASRFVPTVIVASTLERLGIPREMVATRLFGGIEPAFASETHLRGPRDLRELERMVRHGLTSLQQSQHFDGGWGWTRQSEQSHTHTTGYVVWSLALARGAGVDVDRQMIDRGVSYLDVRLVDNDLDEQAWMLNAITSARPAPTDLTRASLTRLWDRRSELTSFGRALLALALHQSGDRERATILARNLEDRAIVDATPDKSFLVKAPERGTAPPVATAHWGSRGTWRYWSDGPVETTSFVLRALVTIDPDSPLVEPAMNWLVKNRRGAQWTNTRDTSLAVLALAAWLDVSGELDQEAAFEVSLNGRRLATKHITKDEMVSAPASITVDPGLVADGRNEIVVRQFQGRALYLSAVASFFSLEEPVTPAGNEIFIKREYYRLVPRPTLHKGWIYDEVPLRTGESVSSGEHVEVVVTIESKNDWEHILLEDLKPAGLEATDLTSDGLWATRIRAAKAEERMAGRESDRTSGTSALPARDWIAAYPVYRELRDRKVAMFIDQLPQGVWEIRYQLRAEVPGAFHALPLMGRAYYVPEIRANSAEVTITVEERRGDRHDASAANEATALADD